MNNPMMNMAGMGGMGNMMGAMAGMPNMPMVMPQMGAGMGMQGTNGRTPPDHATPLPSAFTSIFTFTHCLAQANVLDVGLLQDAGKLS